MQRAGLIGRAGRWLPMALAIGLLGGIGVFFAIAVRDTQQAHRAAEEARLQDTARALSSAVDAQLGAYITGLRAVAATARPLGRDGVAAELEEHLGEAAESLDGVIVAIGPPPDYAVMNVFVAGRHGQRRPARPPGFMDTVRPLLEQAAATRGPVVSHIFPGALTGGGKRIAIYVPFGRNGAADGLLALSISLEAFQRILDRQGLSGGVRAMLADGRQSIVAATNFPPGYILNPGTTRMRTDAIRGRDRAFIVDTVSDGSRRAIALERLTVAPDWHVIVSRPDAELDAVSWHQLRWVQVAGVCFLGIVVLLVMISRRQGRQDAEAKAEALQAGRAEIERLHAGLPAMIFLRDVAPNGTSRRLYRSGDIETVTGWPDAEARSVETLTASSSLSVAGQIRFLRNVLRDGCATTEFLLDRPRGGAQWMRMTGRTIERRPDGSALVVGYLINVNEEVVAREAAVQAQQNLERTLAHAPIAVYRSLIMPTGALRPLYRSPGFLAVTGWHPDAITDRTIFSVLTPDDPDLDRSRTESLRKTGEWRADLEMRRPDGSRFWGRIHSRVLDRKADGTMEVIGYILNITQEKLAEDGARRVQRLASLGEFSSGVAHELRNPLATMMLAAENAQFALECDDKADVDARLVTIIGEIERSSALIEHLRQFAKGSGGEERVEPVPLETVLGSALSLVCRSLDTAGITVARPAPADTEIMVLASRIGLEQVIVNLLVNAGDALGEMPPGHPRRITLDAGLDARTGSATLTVTDTGGGIPREILPRLFEPFVTSKGPDKGTGIGLSICFGLMRSMGGAIEGANTPQGGAVFTLRLPLAPVPDQVVADGKAFHRSAA